MSRRAVFLDRDGTINVDHGYVTCWKDWELLPGVADAIRLLRDSGFAIAVVTNQSAVAKEKCTIADIHELHASMRDDLAKQGAIIDAIVFCPHGPGDGCGCRKPRTGIVADIEQQLGEPINYTRSWTVGDKISDIEFGRALGTRTVLLRSRYWTIEELNANPDVICESLSEAARFIIAAEMGS